MNRTRSPIFDRVHRVDPRGSPARRQRRSHCDDSQLQHGAAENSGVGGLDTNGLPPRNANPSTLCNEMQSHAALRRRQFSQPARRCQKQDCTATNGTRSLIFKRAHWIDA
jgi:hypothetical protein